MIVLSPIPLNDYLQAKLDAETRALAPATVHVVIADGESLAAIGPDANSSDTVPAALEAGIAQASREIPALREMWPTPDTRTA